MDPLDELLDVCTSSGSHQLNLKKKLDLKKIEELVSKKWRVVASTPVVILVKTKYGGISIYQSGKILFKEFDKKKAKEYGKKLLELIGEKVES